MGGLQVQVSPGIKLVIYYLNKSGVMVYSYGGGRSRRTVVPRPTQGKNLETLSEK
jgi:hypothetical protein